MEKRIMKRQSQEQAQEQSESISKPKCNNMYEMIQVTVTAATVTVMEVIEVESRGDTDNY